MPGAKLDRTRYPGIYKRGDRYVVTYRDRTGRQRKETVRTLKAAQALQRLRLDAREAGAPGPTSTRLAEYACEWVEQHQGVGGRTFREETRADYRKALRLYVLPRLGKTRLCDLDHAIVRRFVADLAARGGRGGRPLADATVRNAVSVLSACLRTARNDGFIAMNPCAGVDMPNRGRIVEDEDIARVLAPHELATFLLVAPARHRPLFHLLAGTGLRWSEAAGLDWRHLHLDGSRPAVKVRQRCRFGRVGPLKSPRSRRDVRIDHALVTILRAWHADTDYPAPDDPVFPAPEGGRLRYPKVFDHVLKPTREEAGVPWCGFHTFRHTYASMLLADGATIVQVSRALGHASAAFTLSRYTHLIPGDDAPPLTLPTLAGGNQGVTDAAGTGRNGPE